MSSPSQKQTDCIAKGRFAPGNKLGVRFQPGQSGNPGGSPGTQVSVDVAYKKLISLSPDEFASFKPATIAEVMAQRQVTEAIANQKPLAYAQEITNRTDGPIIRKIEKVDLNAREAERQRFEAAIDLLVEEYGVTRAEAALAMSMVNPSYKKFIEVRDNDSL